MKVKWTGETSFLTLTKNRIYEVLVKPLKISRVVFLY